MFRFSNILPFISICLAALPVKAQLWPLEKCLEYAEQHNPGLLAQGSNITAAESDRKATISQLVPQIEGTAGTDHYWRIPVQAFPGELLGQPAGTFVPVRLGTPWMGNIGAEANLKLVDVATWQAIRLSALHKQVALSEWLSLKKALLKNVRMAFYQAQLCMDHLEITRKRHDSYSESHRLIALQFEKGLTDKITLNQSQGIVKDREDALSRSETALHAALTDLKFWMGYPLDSALSIPEKSDGNFYIDHNTAFNPALLPDYAARELKLRLAGQEYKASLSARYPDLSLKAGYSRLGFGQSIDFISRSEWFASGYVGLQLRVPLLSLGKMIHIPKKQQALMRTAELEFAQYREEQYRRYLQENIQKKEALHAIQVQEQKVRLAAESEGLALKKIEKGIINMIELKQVQEDLDGAQEKLNEARLKFLQHAVELYYLQHNQSE